MKHRLARIHLWSVLVLVVVAVAHTRAQEAAAATETVINDRERPVYVILDVRPIGLLHSPDVDDFYTERETLTTYEREEISGNGSWVPSARLGLGFNTPACYIDITGGGGLLWNNVAPTDFAFADISIPFKLGSKITLGPHYSAMQFGEPDWEGDSDVEFEDADGEAYGLSLTIGGRLVSLRAAIDYWDAEFDVATDPLVTRQWSENQDSLDYSGWSVHVGVNFRF